MPVEKLGWNMSSLFFSKMNMGVLSVLRRDSKASGLRPAYGTCAPTGSLHMPLTAFGVETRSIVSFS